MAGYTVTLLLVLAAVHGGSIADAAATCDAEFVLFDGSCYHFSVDTLKWTDARDKCRTFPGGNLLRIESEAENEFIKSQVSEDTWFDLNDREKEGTFTYTSGTSPSFLNWEHDKPSGTNDDDDCVEICLYYDNYKWVDWSCDTSHKYVCEVPASV